MLVWSIFRLFNKTDFVRQLAGLRGSLRETGKVCAVSRKKSMQE